MTLRDTTGKQYEFAGPELINTSIERRYVNGIAGHAERERGLAVNFGQVEAGPEAFRLVVDHNTFRTGRPSKRNAAYPIDSGESPIRT